MGFPPLVEPVAALSDAERARTARHAALVGFGELAQRQLAAARIAIVGAGGLGSPAVLALAAAGVGELVVIDDDTVELSNLHRQVMHRVRDVGAPKVDSAVRVAADLAPETVVHTVRERITAQNAAAILDRADVVIDGTDTFESRSAVAAACERSGAPLVWGTVQEFNAQITVFWSSPPTGSPVVLADLYPPETVGEVPTCADAGVLGALCMQVGGILAVEAIKLVTGIGEPLFGRVLLIDALGARTREVPLRAAETTAPAAPARQIALVHPRDLAQHRAAGAHVLDVREPHETATGTIDGAVLIPLDTLLHNPDTAGPGPFIVVCQAGARARRAAAALQNAGAAASVLDGGMNAYARYRMNSETTPGGHP